MNVPAWLWFVTIGGLVAIILADLLLVNHKPHAVTIREATRWVLFYVALAVAFGVGLWLFAGGQAAGSSSPGTSPSTRCRWTTCSSSSSSWRRSRCRPQYQHRVLLVGIVIALVMRGIFIAIGAAAMHAFSWVFYLFAVVPDLHRGEPGAAGHRARRGVQGELRAAAGCAGCCRSPTEYHGAKLVRQGRRQAHGHADAGGHVRHRLHRPAVRPRLHPGDLRPDPGAVHGVHRQRLRADGPAPAVLPARRAADRSWSTCPTGCRSSSASSASS